ncbi:TPA: DEAD/DEAH box helicase [Candidatus Avigastranaerophilus faecigallinarum]|nr:DEAD/DEAH box helicase [Candidatus Avigastranaerophilus faecigallinarum]
MYKFDFELDDFQKEAVKCIDESKSVVVCAPTGAGKTCIAEHAIHKALEENTRLFYTTPLKALSNQKFYDFGRKYGEGNVGLLTGDTSINRDAPIVVMTTEVFRNMLYNTNFGKVKDNLKDVKYVVLDEVHYMNDEQRGTVWEESIIYCPPSVQIIALSATVANSKQLCDWINTVHSGTEHVYTDFRPVPLRYYYFDSSKPTEILPLLTPEGRLNKKIKPEKKMSFHSRQAKRQNTVKDIINVLHKKEMLPAIFFTFSRKKCDENMEKCSNLNLITNEEAKLIREEINEFLKDHTYLENNKNLEYLYNGIASHHAGLLPAWKLLVERLFQKGLIKVVFATETLAAGINMPARTTVISAISKRTDSGHRMLTANEFLQMSGRAGRRGMDKIGYVVIMGTQFQSPDEVASLVKSSSNPLESRFSPSYSMVLNLLQNLELEQAKELILKSFGYFSSNDRLKPIIMQQLSCEQTLAKLKNEKCPFGLTNEEFIEFNKLKEKYIVYRKLTRTLQKQAKQKGQKDAPEVLEYLNRTREMREKLEKYRCELCKGYKKHVRNLEIINRFEKKLKDINKNVANQKDIYWNKFLAHKNILEKMGYLENGYPTDAGITCSMIRAENELYISEIILKGVLEGLEPYELASVICALVTEDLRSDVYPNQPISKNTRKALNRIKEIRRKIAVLQRDYEITTEMYLNSYYCPLVEQWVQDTPWEDIAKQVDSSEGDIVRILKRVVDVLRQLTILPNISEEVKNNAKTAIQCILKEPVDAD